MHPALRERFAARKLLLDGATGTELARRGVATPLPLWSAGAIDTNPHIVEQIHRDYVLAGADILVANTFRTNPRRLRNAGVIERGAELNRRAIELARSAAAAGGSRGRDVIVAASVAPVEDCYHPERVPEDAELVPEHRWMVEWIQAAGADLAWIETMNTLREARIAAESAARVGLPFAISFVVAESGDLLSGDPLEEAVATVERLDPLAVGINCIPPEGATALLPRLRRASSHPVAVYAHLGNPEPILGWSFSSDVDPAAYAEHAERWLTAGATIIGGCCGTTPAHIAALRDLLDRRP